MKVSFVTRMLTAALLCARTIGASPASNDSMCECLSVYEPVCCDGVQFPSTCHAKCDGLPGELVAGCVSANCSQIDDETFSDGADDATRVMARRRLFRAWSRRYEGDTWFDERDVIDWINSLNDDGLESFLEALELDELAQSPNYAAHDVDYDHGYDAYAYYDDMMDLDDIFKDKDTKSKDKADEALKAVDHVNGDTIMTLVHATNKKGYDGIGFGLNTMHEGKGGLVGPGMYFAETTRAAKAKAVQGLDYLIYARVRVGNPVTFQDSKMGSRIGWANGITPFKNKGLEIIDQTRAYLAQEKADSIHFVNCAKSYAIKGAAWGPEWIVFNADQIYVVAKTKA